MRVGKTEVARCDQCGWVINDKIPDTVKIGDVLRHFCPESECMELFFIERLRHIINREVEKQVREEFNFIHKQVCPACRHRLITKVK